MSASPAQKNLIRRITRSHTFTADEAFGFLERVFRGEGRDIHDAIDEAIETSRLRRMTWDAADRGHWESEKSEYFDSVEGAKDRDH